MALCSLVTMRSGLCSVIQRAQSARPGLGTSMCKNLEALNRHSAISQAAAGSCSTTSAQCASPRSGEIRPSPSQQTTADAKEDQNPKHTQEGVLVLADLKTISAAFLAGSAGWESRQRREVGALGLLSRSCPAASIGVPGRLHERGVPLLGRPCPL